MAHLPTPKKITQTGSYPVREIYSVASGMRVAFTGPDMWACCRIGSTPGANVLAGTTPMLFQEDNCDVSDSITTELLDFNLELEPNDNAGPGASTPAAGSILFGICCKTEIVFALRGDMRATVSGLDWIEILVNGVQAYYKASDSTEGYVYWRDVMGIDPVTNPHATYRFTDTVTIPLSVLPCGNIIEVRGATGAVSGDGNPEFWAPPIGWLAQITSLT